MRTSVLALLLAAVAAGRTSAAEGPALFKQNCVPCHGPKGDGNTPVGKTLKVKDLGSAEVQKLSDAQLADVVLKGRGKMPAFGARLAADDVKALVTVIRSLARK